MKGGFLKEGELFHFAIFEKSELCFALFYGGKGYERTSFNHGKWKRYS